MVQENNLLIAFFMGFEWEVKDHYGINIIKDPKNNKGYGKGALKFHESWDLLMPVVQKIIKELKYDVTISCEIDVTYLNVINFIKWYNFNVKDK